MFGVFDGAPSHRDCSTKKGYTALGWHRPVVCRLHVGGHIHTVSASSLTYQGVWLRPSSFVALHSTSRALALDWDNGGFSVGRSAVCVYRMRPGMSHEAYRRAVTAPAVHALSRPAPRTSAI